MNLYFPSDQILFSYFSSSCRQFTPILMDFYDKYAQEKNFEIIYLGSGGDEQSFNRFYKEMPWLTLEFKEQNKRKILQEKFRVPSVPTLILLDGDTGKVICKYAKDKIEFDDTTGEEFPWFNIKENKPACTLL